MGAIEEAGAREIHARALEVLRLLATGDPSDVAEAAVIVGEIAEAAELLAGERKDQGLRVFAEDSENAGDVAPFEGE